MNRLAQILAGAISPTVIVLVLLVSAGPALASQQSPQPPDHVPGEVVVRFKGEADTTIKLPPRLGVKQTVRALKKNPRVRYAAPNHIASIAAAGFPGDSGLLSRPKRGWTSWPKGSDPPLAGTPGGWMEKQWNFLPYQPVGKRPVSAGGIDVIGAWRNLRKVGRAGGRGVTVAVIDTGVAYRNYGRRFRRNPDLDPRQIVPGWDFVNNSRHPIDRNGHGTHVAGTIAQKTGNAVGLTGIAYKAKIMPVRVLDAHGNGASDRIAAGIRWAVDHGAHVINMSFNFACSDRVPNVAAAIRYAHRKGVVAVASVGNAQTETCVSPPATIANVIGVGGTTEGGCLGEYSLAGPGLDLVAPGGGLPLAGIGCEGTGSRPIYQVTFAGGDRRRFGFPEKYFGTSMAAAHVSGVAALVIASGVLGNKPKPRAVARRLMATTRAPMAPIKTAGYGAGIVDAAAATDRSIAAGSKHKRG